MLSFPYFSTLFLYEHFFNGGGLHRSPMCVSLLPYSCVLETWKTIDKYTLSFVALREYIRIYIYTHTHIRVHVKVMLG